MEAFKTLINVDNGHRLVQIDIDAIAGNDESIEDMFDILTIELRKHEETIAWEEVKSNSQ